MIGKLLTSIGIFPSSISLQITASWAFGDGLSKLDVAPAKRDDHHLARSIGKRKERTKHVSWILLVVTASGGELNSSRENSQQLGKRKQKHRLNRKQLGTVLISGKEVLSTPTKTNSLPVRCAQQSSGALTEKPSIVVRALAWASA